jgi:guanylate kinase
MTPEEIEALQKQNEELAEQLKAAEAAKGGNVDQERLAFLEAEVEEARKARDKAKEEKRIADAAKLAEQGEYKTLAEQAQEKADELAKQIEEKTATLDKYKERDKAELAATLEKVPEELRESINDESISLEKRLELAKKLAVTKQEGAGSRRAGSHEVDSLEVQLQEAKEAGNVELQIALKNKIFQKKKE